MLRVQRGLVSAHPFWSLKWQRRPPAPFPKSICCITGGGDLLTCEHHDDQGRSRDKGCGNICGLAKEQRPWLYLIMAVLVRTLKAVDWEGAQWKKYFRWIILATSKEETKAKRPAIGNIWGEGPRYCSRENVKAEKWLGPCPRRKHPTLTLRE